MSVSSFSCGISNFPATQGSSSEAIAKPRRVSVFSQYFTQREQNPQRPS
jgi:hypothetical protein